jgi:hypothetical protein
MSKLVPFGKYKGQPVEAMIADQDYCQWLAAQDWFRSRYAAIHTLVINYGAEPDETPEHNRMQARFLDDSYCLALARVVEPAFSWSREEMNEKVRAWEYPVTGVDDFVDCKISRKSFEVGGWDVVFCVKHGGEVYWKREASLIYSESKWLGATTMFHVECKPCIGDDYPKVMRQIRNYQLLAQKEFYLSKEVVLLIDQFAASAVSYAQMSEIFKTAGITTIMAEELSP